MLSFYSQSGKVKASTASIIFCNFDCGFVMSALGFLWITKFCFDTSKRFGAFQRDRFIGFDPFEVPLVRWFPIDLVILIACGVAFSSLHCKPVIIGHGLEGAFVDNCLISFQTDAFLTFESLDRDLDDFS